MKPIILPVSEVNSTVFTITEWLVSEGSTVKTGQVLGHAETAKAIYDISAPGEGVFAPLVTASQTGEFQKPLGFLFASLAEHQTWRKQLAEAATQKVPGESNVTDKAAELAAAHKLDLTSLKAGGHLVTRKMVEAEVARLHAASTPRSTLAPLTAPSGIRKLAIIGAGYGATQVLDILAHDASQKVVALFVDYPETWNTTAHDLPVVGGSERLGELFKAGAFEAAIVSISTSVPARTKFRLLCRELGIPLANAIDPSCRIARGVKIGSGNVINAFCFIGTGTVVGDNNFFSAYNSIDHHCQVGSDISTGPGFMVSGLVKLGNALRIGTGVFVQPLLEIGDGVQIASGSVIVGNIPSYHAVKTKIVTTQVTPIH